MSSNEKFEGGDTNLWKILFYNAAFSTFVQAEEALKDGDVEEANRLKQLGVILFGSLERRRSRGWHGDPGTLSDPYSKE